MKGITSRKVIGLGIVISVAIVFAVVATADDTNPQGALHYAVGYVYAHYTNVTSPFAEVHFYNLDRGEWWNITADQYGFFSTNLGTFSGAGWDAGENITIYAYGNSSHCWGNWSGTTSGVIPVTSAWFNITMETPLAEYDVGTLAINSPPDGASLCPTPVTYVINATVANLGSTYTHTFPVELYVYDNLMNLVYYAETTVTLAPGETTYVEFNYAFPDATMDYTIVVTTNMTCPNHDYKPWNDAKSIGVHVDQRVVDMVVDKKVWNGTAWVYNVTVPGVPSTVIFNISIHNNGVCSDLTNITITDTLGDGLEYVPGSATVNGVPIPDPSIAGNTLTWSAADIGYEYPAILQYCHWIYLHFEANVTEWGTATNYATIDAVVVPTWEPVSEVTPTVTVITDNTPPTTSIAYGEPNCVKDCIYVTSDTPITLTAIDDVTGVNQTVYWIDAGAPVVVYDNSAADEDPDVGEVAVTFYLTGSDGPHTIYFYSVDNAGNVEATNTQVYCLDNTGPEINVVVDGPQYDSYVTSETNFSFEVSDAGSGGRQETILQEDFEGGVPPADWEMHIYGGTGVWESRYVDGSWKDPYGASGYYAIADSDSHSSDVYNVGLRTPPMDLSGYTNVVLTCGIAYENVAGYDYAEIRVLSNGGTTVEEVLAHWDYDVHQIQFTATLDVANYSHPEDVQVEFYYNTNGYTWLWFFSVDNVEITGEHAVPEIPVYYRIWYNGTWTDWYLYTQPFNLEGDCMHIIQAMAEDCLGNIGLYNFTYYVDNTPPVVEKIITGPGMYNYTWITSETLFTLNATDPEGGSRYVLQTTLLDEKFEGTFPPSGWTVIGPLWDRNDYWGRTNYAGGYGYCADADSDKYGTGGDSELWTPVLDLSGYSAATLTFIASYNYFSGDYADVDISIDGGSTWTNLLHWAEDHDPYGPGELVTIDLTPYVGNNNVIIRWHYYAPGWDWYYEIDNVTITAEGGGALPCASGVNATYYRIWYNGSWSDWYIYDGPFNLSGHCMHMIEFYAVDNVGNEGEHTIQTHYLDESVPECWLTIDQDPTMQGAWRDYITPATEFTIYASTEGCNGTSAPYVIYFTIEGPEGSKFYYNGNYYNCNGTWIIGYNNTPVAFQIRDEHGFAPNGLYRVKFYAINLVTGEAGPQGEETFKIDTTPPLSEILFSGDYYISSYDMDTVYVLPSTIMKFTADDGKGYEGASGVKLIKYRIDYGVWKIYEDDEEITFPEGEHVLQYFAKDWLGNTGNVITKTIVVDTVAPQVTIDYDGKVLNTGSKVAISPETKVVIAASDDASGVGSIYYAVDGEEHEYNGEFTLSPGEHTIEFYAEDNLGNRAPISHATIYVDNKAPSIYLEKPKEKYIYIAGRAILPLPRLSQIDALVIGPVSIQATAYDDSKVTKMSIYIDGEKRIEENEGSVAWQWDETTSFVHTIKVEATDYFGYTSSSEIKVFVINI